MNLIGLSPSIPINAHLLNSIVQNLSRKKFKEFIFGQFMIFTNVCTFEYIFEAR